MGSMNMNMNMNMCATPQPSQLKLIHHHSPLAFPSSISLFRSSSRLKNVVKLHIKERLIVASASNSNSNPSGGESSKGKSGGGISSDAANKGPPFLTIVAGFLVFFCIIWVFGSIIMWFLGPIVKLVSSK